MDPVTAFGAAAAAAQFAELTFKGLKLAIEVASRIRSPPPYIQAAIQQLELLQTIQKEIAASTTSQSVIDASLRCDESVRALMITLQKIDRSLVDGNGEIILKAVNSIRYEEEINESLQRLEGDKENLSLALATPSIMHSTVKSAMADFFNAENGIPQSLKDMPGSIIPSDQSGVDMFLRELNVHDPQDVRQRLIKSKGDRVDGTCTWVLEHNSYQSWLSGSTQSLWIRGGPGRGKTMMSIFLTQELERCTAERSGVLLYFFCDSQDSKLSSEAGILQSLIHQLAIARPPLAYRGLAEYQLHGKSAATNVETLWRIVTAMLHDLSDGPVFILIDGLDECDKESQAALSRGLAELHTKSATAQQRVKPIIISRPLDLRHLSQFGTLQLDTEANANLGQDLSLFIHSRIDKIAVENNYSEALRNKVLSTVLEKSEGTFLWAGFVLHDLQEKAIVDVEKCLVSLPRGLDDIYSRILENIPDDNIAVVQNILKWVVMAFRPLMVSELAAAVGLRSTETVSAKEAITVYINICSHLLSISQGTVRLVHQSAKDFLVNNAPARDRGARTLKITPQTAHAEMAQLCISVLESEIAATTDADFFEKIFVAPPRSAHTDDDADDDADDELLGKYSINAELDSLIGYSVEHWQHHARLGDGSTPGHDAVVSSFLKTPSCQAWVRVCHRARMITCPVSLLLRSGAHLASFLGLKTIVGAKISKKRFKLKRLSATLSATLSGSSPVCTALLGGHNDIVKILIEQGGASLAKAASGASFFNSPIHIAAATNNVPALKLLHKMKADVNQPDSELWTPIHHAAFMDSAEACQFLLEHGACVNVADRSKLPPIYYATVPPRTSPMGLVYYLQNPEYRSHARAFTSTLSEDRLGKSDPKYLCATQVLLNANADANVWIYDLSLLAAIRFDRLQDVRALVHAGADLTVALFKGIPPLYCAFYFNRPEIAAVLVKAGAKINQELEREHSLLFYSSCHKNANLFKVAMEAGADASPTFTDGRALEYAAVSTSRDVLAMVYDSDLVASHGHTALKWAAAAGNWDNVKFLLDKGVRVGIDDGGLWEGILVGLREHRDPTIVKSLVEAGANPNTPVHGNITPLVGAMWTGQREVMVELIKAGADVNVKSSGEDTPLLLAIRERDEGMVRLLLDAGARMEDVGECGVHALYVAVSLGFGDIADVLIKAGADVNVKSSGLGAPLFVAIHKRNEGMVRLLLDAGARMEDMGKSGVHALHVAVDSGFGDIADVLIKAGADVNAITGILTALALATLERKKDMVELLLQNGADKTFRVEGVAITDLDTSEEIKELFLRS